MYNSAADTSLSGDGMAPGDPPSSDRSFSDAVANETQASREEEWVPSKHEKAIIYTLAFLNLIVSLDATIIVTSLAVR